MNRKEIVDRLAEKTGLTKGNADKFLDGFTELVTEELTNGGNINLMGFGKFEAVKRAARAGVHPRTLEPIKIDEFMTPKFVAGTLLKRAVKGE